MSEEESNLKPEKKRLIESLREWIGLISAGTGIFAALLYLAGRSFASGYFEAMNIPHYMVSFSIWEYGEVGWFPMVLYPIGMMILGGFFWTVVYGIGGWLAPVGVAFGKWIGKRIKIRWPTWKLPEISRQAKVAYKLTNVMVSTFACLIFVGYALQFVRDQGAINGQLIILERAAKVELVAATPMTLDGASIMTTPIGQGENQYFVYKGFRLLTFNGDKYYLFKEIDPVTCKPLQVYVIDAEQYKQIHLSAAESLSSQCQKNNKASQTGVTPTAIPATVP